MNTKAWTEHQAVAATRDVTLVGNCGPDYSRPLGGALNGLD